jgi:hypothetical protein
MVRDSTPSFLARQLIRRFKKSYGDSLSHCEFYFDNSLTMHSKRSEVSLVRASRMEPLTAQDAETIRKLGLERVGPGHLETTMPWDLLLKSNDSKMQCWELLARALWKQAIIEGIAAVKVQSQNYSESTGGTSKTTVQWGEADMSAAAAADQLDNVLIATIDYDQVLQALVATPTAKQKWLAFKAEVVDASKLAEMYGPTDNCRLHAAVLLLCAFKSDYSKAVAKKVGMTTAKIVEHMRVKTEDECCLVERREEGSRTLLFRPRMLCKCLRKQPPIDAVDKILWTVAYFRGYHAKADPPAAETTPLPPSIFLKGEDFAICTEDL